MLLSLTLPADGQGEGERGRSAMVKQHAMKVTEFAFVGHPVASLRRAREFYEEVLRFPEPNVLDGALDSDDGMVIGSVFTSGRRINDMWIRS